MLWFKLLMNSSQDDLMGRVPQEHRDRIDLGRQFLKEYFPEERRDQFIYRGKKVGYLFDNSAHILTIYFVGDHRMPETR